MSINLRGQQSTVDRTERLVDTIQSDTAAHEYFGGSLDFVPQAEVLRIALDRGLATLESFYFGEAPLQRRR